MLWVAVNLLQHEVYRLLGVAPAGGLSPQREVIAVAFIALHVVEVGKHLEVETVELPGFSFHKQRYALLSKLAADERYCTLHSVGVFVYRISQ